MEETDEMCADRYHIMCYPSFSFYLDQLLDESDLFHFRKLNLARNIVKLGYRNNGETLQEEQFVERWNRVLGSTQPIKMTTALVSQSVVLAKDRLIEALTVRERANRAGVMTTIVFVRIKNSNEEYGGFIDFNDRLMKTDMVPFFSGKRRLIPKRKDLGFFNWRTRISYTNDSDQIEEGPCKDGSCLGSIMYTNLRHPVRSKEDVLKHAKEFIDQYFASIRRANSPAHEARWDEVQKEVMLTGTYDLTETELVYGCKLAWRNAPRCIGRIQWAKLQVFDCRHITTTNGMFTAICNHIKYSTNKGNVRSAITIFPQRSPDGKHDYRVWSPQLIQYAGYKNEDGTITGDPRSVEFTEVCMKLGWQGKRTRFDVLPIVLSAGGKDPDYYELPEELVMEVPLSHPKYDWFGEMGLKWFVMPMVSHMMFDCGGVQFTACPFNGWYMCTEIGARNLCDTSRYNLLESIGQKMGLDTRSPVTLWKDRVLVETNIAVLHSFQLHNATIVDHHTASESFMKHLENEQRLRGGCPADWVWIVPPLSGSVTPVFHQEMLNYWLYPAYQYQEPAWKTHIWNNTEGGLKEKNKHTFKNIARAVKLTSNLFGNVLSKRIKATILYATETGKSEMYAKKLAEIFSHAFHSQVLPMEEYDTSKIEHEALLIVVASTFGNGDPPENGQGVSMDRSCKTFFTDVEIAEELLDIGESEDEKGLG